MKALASLTIACLALSAFCQEIVSDPQIVGGKDAPDGLYPYQVSLRFEGEHFCGGAIIGKRHILTTAHCVFTLDNPYVLYVAVGSNYLDKPAAVHRAISILVHAGYNRLLRIHDIALISLSSDIEFNENVRPIALPNTDRNYDGYPLVATGWGRLKAEGPFSNHLQEIIAKGYPQSQCNNDYNGLIKESHICTFTLYGEGMCNGDFGNPLVADGVLVGLSSHVHPEFPCATGFPDVSTRVFYYKSWIAHHTFDPEEPSTE